MAIDPIRTFLIDEFEQAKEQHREARERYWEAAGRPRQLPRVRTDLPGSADDIIRRAVAEESAARSAHLTALVRLNRYLVEGVIPEELAEMGTRPKARKAAAGS